MVQTAGVIALAGSLLAVAIPAFERTVRKSKVAEATTELDRIHRAVATYYSASLRLPNHCLPDAAGPTPLLPTAEPIAVVFGAGDDPGSASWRALGYEPSGPTRYSYSFAPHVAGCGLKMHGDLATMSAVGDLDGDGQRSSFERRFTVSREHEVLAGDVLVVRDRIE